MNNRCIVSFLRSCLIVFILSAILMFSYYGPVEAAGPIVIKGITGLPQTHLAAQPFFKVMEKFNKRAKGEALIKYIGGPEVFAPPNQAMAVIRGSVDMAQTFAAVYSGLVPMVKALPLSRITPKEERENGAFNFLQELHRKVGLVYLGRGQSAPPGKGFFWIWTTKKVKDLKDLKGLRIGGISPAASTFIKALGAVPKTISYEEGYTAIDRGVINGWWISFEDVVTSGMYEVLPYCIDHPWYCDNDTFTMNPDSWNKLPKNIQDLLTECIKEVENTWYYEVEKRWAKDRKIMLGSGMKFIKFSAPDAKWYVNTAYEAKWAEILREHPIEGLKLKKLFSK